MFFHRIHCRFYGELRGLKTLFPEGEDLSRTRNDQFVSTLLARSVCHNVKLKIPSILAKAPCHFYTNYISRYQWDTSTVLSCWGATNYNNSWHAFQARGTDILPFTILQGSCILPIQSIHSNL